MSSYSIAAIKARMGSTPYFQAVMRADQLAATVKAAMDFPEFETFMAHEQMQRKLNESRVEKEIVPYLTNSPDRFFGSIIVLAYQPETFEFESIRELSGSRLKGSAYEGKDDQLGVLTIEGGKLFALDGQHRLHALRTIVKGGDTPHLKLPITGEFKDVVAGDQLSVIFLQFESVEKARRIFNKVNRYAKPTSPSTNILTSEDDGYAIITRAIIGDDDPDKFGGTIDPPLNRLYPNSRIAMIEMEKQSLSAGDEALTTLSVIYNAVRAICFGTGNPNLDEKQVIVRPTDDVLAKAYDDCAKWLKAIMEMFTPYNSRNLNAEYPKLARVATHRSSFAFRPKCQEVMINGLMIAHQKTGLTPQTLIGRLDLMPLKLDAMPWTDLLVGGKGKMIIKNAATAEKLVAYFLIGDRIGAKMLRELEEGWRSIHGGKGLPKPLN
jgi:DNA sulfur modification protein DndB